MRAVHPQLGRVDEAMQARGRLDPDEVMRTRKRLRLSKREVSRIFVEGRETFSRYESDAIWPFVPRCHLLCLLDAGTQRSEEFLEDPKSSREGEHDDRQS